MAEAAPEGKYDPARGWVELPGHVGYRFSSDRARGGASFVSFLNDAGVAFVDGDIGRMTVDALRFDTFFLANAITPSLHLRWERRRSAAQHRFMFLFFARGRGEIVSEGPVRAASEGGLYIIFPSGSPVDLIATHSVDVLLFTFDESTVLPISLTSDTVQDVSLSSSVLRASYASLRTLTRGATEIDPQMSSVVRGLVQQMARALSASITRPHRDHFIIGSEMIVREHVDPALTPDRIAVRLGVSRSTLDRSFGARGSSVAREIRRARARTALEAIDEEPGLSPEAVARRSGFASVASLRRSFVDALGVTLAEKRRR